MLLVTVFTANLDLDKLWSKKKIPEQDITADPALLDKLLKRWNEEDLILLETGNGVLCHHTNDVLEHEYCQSFCQAEGCKYLKECWACGLWGWKARQAQFFYTLDTGVK